MERSTSIFSDNRVGKTQPLPEVLSSSANTNGAHSVDTIVGQSDAIKFVLFKAEKAASTDATVQLLG